MRRQPLLLGCLLAFSSGCATLLHGSYQDVQIESNPPGATATVSAIDSQRGPLFLDPKKEYKFTTPGTINLRRDNTYRVEFSMPGYKIYSAKVVSAYDWLWAPVACGPCEAVGQLPTFDMKERPLPLRFTEAAFYSYPKGFFSAWGRGLRIFSPEALMGTAYKLKPEDGGFFSDWHGLGTPTVSTTLQPID
jgi:hypothetical protein